MAYTSITAGATPSFNGVTYVSGPGGNVTTGGLVVGDVLGWTTADTYSTVRYDNGISGSSGIRGVGSRQQLPGSTLIQGGWSANAFHIQGPTSNDWLNINAGSVNSPHLQAVGMDFQGWTSGYGKQTVAVDGTTGSIQSGTQSGGVGARLWSGSGAPVTPGGSLTYNLGDAYLRTDTPSTANQRLYMVTTAGTAPVWTGVL